MMEVSSPLYKNLIYNSKYRKVHTYEFSRKSYSREIIHIFQDHGLGTSIGDYEIHLDVQYKLLSQTLRYNIEQIHSNSELTLLVGAMWELLEETFSETSSIIPYEHIHDFAEYYLNIPMNISGQNLQYFTQVLFHYNML